MNIIVPVQIEVPVGELPGLAEPLAAECPQCFAMIRAARMDDHLRAAHAKES